MRIQGGLITTSGKPGKEKKLTVRIVRYHDEALPIADDSVDTLNAAGQGKTASRKRKKTARKATTLDARGTRKLSRPASG